MQSKKKKNGKRKKLDTKWLSSCYANVKQYRTEIVVANGTTAKRVRKRMI